MLTARKSSRACQSCRLQLLSLFENGFAHSPSTNASRLRRSGTPSRPFQTRYPDSRRMFSTTRIRTEKSKEGSQDVGHSDPAEIETIVRQARQTFGQTLPKDYLSPVEYALYERLYGPPLKETTAEDLEYIPNGDGETEQGITRNVLLRENADGEFDEIEFDPELGFSVVRDGQATEEITEVEADDWIPGEDPAPVELEDEISLDDAIVAAPPAESTVNDNAEPISAQGQNQREIDVIARLQLDMEASALQVVEEEVETDQEIEREVEVEEDEQYHQEDELEAYIDSDTIRTHPHTMTGRSGTFPSTLTMPNGTLVEPITKLLLRTSNKHLTEAAEKELGGRGLPYSPSTPISKRQMPQKEIALSASQHRMSEIQADVFLAAVMPQTYISVMSTLVEVRKRLGSSWVRDLIKRKGGEGPRILDAGAAGAGVVAWQEIVQAEWDVMKDEGVVEGEKPPPGKTTVLNGSNALRNRMSRFLDDTTFLPRLPDYIHASEPKHLDPDQAENRKTYDIIIAPHSLLHLKEDFRRKNMVKNLWSLLDPNGGVLILIEKGMPRGFEAIAGARAVLLDSVISSPGSETVENEMQSPDSDISRFKEKEEGMIIAPCTNHSKCPMYLRPGLSTGRKDFCHFPQRYIRPNFLQRVLGAAHRNHEDVKFSYLAVRRGVDARKSKDPITQGDLATEQAFEGYEEHDLPDSNEASVVRFNALSLPRHILSPLKRHGHVIMDLCTPSGTLERWTVARSFSKAAYRDARKSKWGDLWALGAGTRVQKNTRLGRLSDDKKLGKVAPTKQKKKDKFNIMMGSEGYEGLEQDRSQTRYVKRERRTKGGRLFKQPKSKVDADDDD